MLCPTFQPLIHNSRYHLHSSNFPHPCNFSFKLVIFLNDVMTLDVHYPTVVLTSSFVLTLSGTCSYHLSWPSLPDNFSHITSNKLLLQYCHVCLYSLWDNFLHSQTIWFTLSRLLRHITFIRGIPPSCQYGNQLHLVLGACSWAANIGASVLIFKSAFRNLLQVSLTCVVSGISLKIDHAAFFPSNCRVSRCFQ